ncbi:flagellar associated protein [Monoraphidium neglectum]|uniref:Flagellar associated protein n=1 Tax=Monoraphidium neglectum TaxID=145388 RepID=A0A0D2IWN4_9CHLO|nr:flagellar associated protein [Monoraphidium neglectum]KIY92397.1 flagellar associated protein [Monoraphidium neglectum]|eukprot:XP_013891417.1 flagellar associated protein [Monoraphidium neglectum]
MGVDGDKCGPGTFVVDARLEGAGEVLQIPVIKPKTLKRLLAGVGPRPPLLGAPCTPTTDDTLELLLQRLGSLLGKDPSKWEQTGDPKTDVSLTEDGTKRIITKTGVYSGTELHMWAVPPYFDDRLPVRGDRPDLSFNVQRREIAATEEWQEAAG